MKIIIDLNNGGIYFPDTENSLTPAELRLIKILKRQEDKAVATAILEEELNNDFTGNTFSSVAFHVSTLRSKLGHSKETPVIVNKQGIGYILLSGRVGFV